MSISLSSGMVFSAAARARPCPASPAAESTAVRSSQRSPAKAAVRGSVIVLRGKRGMFDIAVPLAFFVVLVVFALVILMLKTGTMRDTRPELDDDLSQLRANTMLINLLRTNAPLGYEGTGKKAPLADIIILGADGRYDDAILNALSDNIPSTAFILMRIDYGSRSITLSNGKMPNDMYDGVAQAQLPGGDGIITVTMHYTDMQLLENKKFERALIPERSVTIIKDGGQPTTSKEELGKINAANQQRITGGRR